MPYWGRKYRSREGNNEKAVAEMPKGIGEKKIGGLNLTSGKKEGTNCKRETSNQGASTSVRSPHFNSGDGKKM